MMRTMLLGAANSRPLQRFVTKHGRRLGAYRFVAGETLDEFMAAVRATNARGMRVAAGLLGEDVRSIEDASAVAAEYRSILDRFAADGADANVALKLTHLGLAAGDVIAFENLSSIASHAAACGNFVRIDMEQSAFTDATLAIYRRALERGLNNVGTVLQAYLYRSESDLGSLLELAPNLRLVKGAYLEPEAIAFPSKRDVDANYVRLIEMSLRGDGFTAIATHDETVIEHTISFISRRGVRPERFEFQMLYGVRPQLQARLVERGYAVRIAVPFGTQWFPYFMRRLAERPANVFFFLGSMWRS
jgi:proline dehydrogenase